MTAESTIWLHSLGVVVAAKYHNPSILNKDFLACRRIVPESWKVEKTITTPAVSVIEYANGVQWAIDQDRLTITEACDLPFQQNENSNVHDQAALYVETLPHTPYTAVSLNYVVSTTRKDPKGWITQHFLNEAFHRQELVMEPGFTVDTGDATLNLMFRAGNASRNKKKHKSVVIDCNIHYGGQLDSVTLKTKILGWKGSKDTVYSELAKMLGEH